jgi:hypothetical protein
MSKLNLACYGIIKIKAPKTILGNFKVPINPL